MVQAVYKQTYAGVRLLDMGSRREDVDLALLIMDPFEARRYVSEFDFGSPAHLRPEHLVLDSGREIIFKTMNDQEAVEAARALLGVEIQRVLNQLSYENFVH